MNRLKNVAYIILSLFFVAGCETIPEQSQTTVEWQAHQAHLEKMNQFDATGKIGFRSPDDRISVSFNWKHTPDMSQLKLINVLGKTLLTMTITENGAKVVTSENEVYQNKSANALFYQLTNIVFPVEQMQFWIKGLPSEADSFALNETHTLSSLSKKIGQESWKMNYARYQDIQDIPLPYQMTLEKPDTTLKIVVTNWNIK